MPFEKTIEPPTEPGDYFVYTGHNPQDGDVYQKVTVAWRCIVLCWLLPGVPPRAVYHYQVPYAGPPPGFRLVEKVNERNEVELHALPEEDS